MLNYDFMSVKFCDHFEWNDVIEHFYTNYQTCVCNAQTCLFTAVILTC